MEMKLDPQQFDKRQAILVERIAETIKVKLREQDIEGEKLEHLTSEITFSITNILDDMAAIEDDGIEVRPYLTFLTDDEELLHYGENSCTNEFVYTTLNKLFAKKRD